MSFNQKTLYFTPPTDARESWWIGVSRDEFRQRVPQQVPRMMRNRESAWVVGVQRDPGVYLKAKTAMVLIERMS